MKALPFFSPKRFLAFACAGLLATSAHAQLVADGATNTLSNVTTNFTGDVTVGTNGSFTLLVLSDNALLTNSANGLISRNATANSNEARLVSASARWLMNGTLFVGSNGANATLVVSNGALVRASAGIVGQRTASGSNVALVTGGGSTWSNVNDLTVGSAGSGNQLLVSNGGWVVNGSGSVGNNGSNNVARVTGPGSVWSNRFDLNIGSIGSGNVNNRLLIEDGGKVFNEDGFVGTTGGGSNNFVLVTGSGSLWNNRDVRLGPEGRAALVVSDGGTVLSANGYVGSGAGLPAFHQALVTGNGSLWSNRVDLVVGLAGFGNGLVVSNGGWVVNSSGYVGGFTVVNTSASNNTVTVTGAGSVWSNRADLFLGYAGRGNQLVISNDATVVASNLFVGFLSSSTNNRVTVDGGTLRVTNAAGTSVLDVRRGTSVLNGGLIEADTLRLTNSQGFFEFNGGALSAKNSRFGNGLQFQVGNGVSPATFLLAGNGTHDFSGTLGTLAVSSNAVLLGNGTLISGLLSGVNVRSGGTLSPGTSIGKMTFSTSPSLLGTVLLELSKNGAALTNDQIQVAGTLTYNGALTVSNLGPNTLTAADHFKLFTATAYAGSFTAISLPPLNPGLAWTNKLLVDGSIEVTGSPIGPPTVLTLPASAVSSTTATLNGVANPGGNSATAWFEYGFTTNFGNVTPPQTLGNGTNNVNFNQVLSDLTGGTYQFRAVASNSLGVVFGGNQSFSIGPTVQTLPAFPLDTATARLKGVANPNGTNTSAWFEWGTTTNFGNVTSAQALGGGNSNTNFSEVLTGLTGGVTYHFRAVASNRVAVVTGANRSFLMTDPFAHVLYLKASNTGSNDNFGTSVAMSGDTIVVGAKFESSRATGVNGDQTDNSAVNAGAAYVFVRSGGTWVQQAYLKASNTDPNDNFGVSVTISGDTIVVGALNESSSAAGVNGNQNDNTATNSGAAYVFVRNGTNWSQQAYVKASNAGANDNFGNSVAVSGDTVLVGASAEASNATGVNGNQGDNGAFGSGATYVFVRSGTNWSQQAYLKASNTNPGDRFGVRVAVSGETAVVGADLEDSNATGVNGDQANNLTDSSGAAYVFVRNGTNWTQQAYLKASNTDAFDLGALGQFGIALAISGDTVVVGAPGEASNATGVNGDQTNNAAIGSGAAYVFVRNGTNWAQQAYLKASNTDPFDFFGISAALSGDTLVVGAHGEDSSAIGINGDDTDNTTTGSGAAYVFVRDGTNWIFQSYLKASNPDPIDTLGVPGQAVAVSGGTVVAGARMEDSSATGINGDHSDNSAPDSGAAYIFDLALLSTPALTIVATGPAQVTLSWTPPTPGFALQEALSLSSLGWSNSPSGETNPITIPSAAPTKFYRLFKP